MWLVYTIQTPSGSFKISTPKDYKGRWAVRDTNNFSMGDYETYWDALKIVAFHGEEKT